MKKSGYLSREEAVRKAFVDASEQITRQLMQDTLQITLHNEFGFGYERIKNLTDAWNECYLTYHAALERGAEQDVFQEHLDRELQDVVKDKQALIPFSERYPDIKKISYAPKKRW